MKIAVAKEDSRRDRRVALTPDGVRKLVELGAEVRVESGLGDSIGFSDGIYREAGASVISESATVLSEAEIVLRLNPPSHADLSGIPARSVLVGFLDPFNQPDLLEEMAGKKISALSMELIPRTTLAQKMDALSSQANLAGYVAVIVAASALNKILPMMSTPAGTIPPARVFVIGAGVAGLQAIATAKRLGAIVEAYDTRPVVEEQVRSVGGRFVKLDIGETGETEQGYAKQLNEEQLALQREAMARHCEKSDIVITTAQVFGKKAPVIVTGEMVSRMRPGSVIVDLAVESGGNVEGSKAGEIVERSGVRIIGVAPLAERAALDASQMYSANLVNLVSHFWDKEGKRFVLDLEDEIIAGCLVTHDGAICHPLLK